MSRLNLIALLIILIVRAEQGGAQMSQDPLLGGHILGNSAGMVMVGMHRNNDTLKAAAVDFFPAPSPTSASAPHVYSPGSPFDIAMADVDGDGREESITIWRDADGAPVLSICRYAKGTLLEAQRVSSSLSGARVEAGGEMRVVRGIFDRDPSDELAVAYRTADQVIRVAVVQVDSLTLIPSIAGDAFGNWMLFSGWASRSGSCSSL